MFKSATKYTVKSTSGFTLIEMIIVIIILGILAIIALPRFANISSDAHLAVFHATFGEFKSAIKSSHMVWIVQGSPTGSNAINVHGNIDFNTIGYPAGIDDGSQVTTPNDCLDIFQNILDTSLVTAVPAGDGSGISSLPSNVDFAVTTNNNICYYTFISESNSPGFNARQFRYLYTTGEVVEWDPGYTLP